MNENVKVSLTLDIDNGNEYCLNLMGESDDRSSGEEAYNSLCPNCIKSGVSKVSSTSTKVIMGSIPDVPWIKRYLIYKIMNVILVKNWGT